MTFGRVRVPMLTGLLVYSCSTGWSVDQCMTCHEAIEDRAALLFRGDIHLAKGLGCADCHGGNPELEDMDAAMSKQAGFVGVPSGDAISSACATCHADSEKMKSFHAVIPTNQESLLKASVHGRSSTKGGERIAQCTTCHQAHGIRAVSDRRSPVHPVNVSATCARCHGNPQYMRSYDPSIPVDQLEKYRTSVHGALNAKGDSGVAECASCHGSHGIFAADDVRSSVYPTNLPATCGSCHSSEARMKGRQVPTDQFQLYATSVHGKALLEKNDLAAPACNDCHGNHAATPPGIQSISKVCGTCHALNDELFSGSAHKKAFDELGLPECETCHGNHDIVTATSELLGAEDTAICSRCHAEDQNPRGFAFARDIRFLVDSLDEAYGYADTLVRDARQKGMEIGEAEFRLREARQARLEARTVIHSFNEERTQAVLSKGLATTSLVAGEAQKAIDEYYFRRTGLGVSTIIITILAVSLYLFIRRLERSQERSPSRPTTANNHH